MVADTSLARKRILLIVSGGVAAYKSLELIRGLRRRDMLVRAVMTEGAKRFITPLSVGSLSEHKVYDDLWSLTDEAEMGHIRLSRESDLVVVAPASANIIAKMALGLADDLASTVLLASNTPTLVAPAMNHVMWNSPATQAHIATLSARGVRFVGPDIGAMACGEHGPGRLAEVDEILAAIDGFLAPVAQRLAGRSALVTSGPTREPIDPVRYLSNRSSGKQGHAVAAALARLGARTTLVTGPTEERDPEGVSVVRVETAAQMMAACERALPVDVAVLAAAVSDWTAVAAPAKIKKDGGGPPQLQLTETQDILARLSQPGNRRPALVVGFAAETENLEANARTKLERKGCDLIVANLVGGTTGTFGGDLNTVTLVGPDGVAAWPAMPKAEVAARLADTIADRLAA